MSVNVMIWGNLQMIFEALRVPHSVAVTLSNTIELDSYRRAIPPQKLTPISSKTIAYSHKPDSSRVKKYFSFKRSFIQAYSAIQMNSNSGLRPHLDVMIG